MSELLTQGIVRILDGNGYTVGTGFVVSESGLIATCSHVIHHEKLQKRGQLRPEKVTIVFHATDDEQDARVEPDWFLPWNAGDLAIIRAEGILPQGVRPLPLGSAEGTNGHEVSTFGFPDIGDDDIEGLGADGRVVRILLNAGRSILQLRSSEITAGFSGAPIWDKLGRRVIGMVSVITEPDRHHRLAETAFAISTETLRNVCPVLQLSEVCPYRGLAAFTEADTEFFFGRQQIIDGLLNRLRRDPRFLTVLGPSGSGKSSVVQAGLIPLLKSGKVAGSDRWGIMVTRPATQPFDELTKQGLSDKAQNLTENIRVWMSQHTEQERLVLVIDQLEELLSICPEAIRQDFIIQLVQLLHSPLPITVILVMRDDFYSRLTQQEALVEWLERNRGPLHVPKLLKQDELIAIVQEPTEVVGLRCEENLVKTIVKDTMETAVESEDGGQAGRSAVLPLLEFALTELWKRRQEGLLTHEAYRSIGGVAGALTQWADRAFYALRNGDRQLAQRIFTDLVYIGDESQGIRDSRRHRTLTSLCRNESEQESIEPIVQHLVESRLLATDRDHQSNEETVEIIHDVLLREWGQLKQWIKEDRDFLEWHQVLEQRVQAWISTNTDDPTKRDVYKLFGGSDLTEALEWMKMRTQELSQSEYEFIQASQKHQKKILNRRKFIGIAILGVTGAGFALGHFLFPPTFSLLQSHPSPPFILSGHKDVVTSVAWSLNHQWLATSSYDWTARIWSASTGELAHILNGHTDFVLSVVWSPNSQWLATASFDSTARIWSASTGKLVHILSGHGNAVSCVAWSPNGRWLATSSYDWTARIWEVSTGKLLRLLRHTRSVSGIIWSPDGQWLTTSSDNGTLRIWNTSGLLIHELNGSTENIPIGIMAWSPNSQWLAVASDIVTSYVWKASTGTSLQIPGAQMHSVTRVAWSPDSQWLATSNSRDNSTHLWNIIAGRSGPTFKEHTDSITQIAWSPDSRWLAIASRDKTALIADATTGESLYLFGSHQNAINTIAWSPSGQWAATSSDDHTARVWAPFPAPLLRYTNHTGPVSGVTWSPSGQWVATYSEDATARIWDAVSGQTLHIFNDHKRGFTNIVWSPSGQWIAASSEDGTAQIWDATSGQTLHILNSHQASMNNIAWSPGGQWIATYCSDGNLNSIPYIWDASSGRLLHVLNDHPPFTTAIAWSPNGQWLATSSEYGTARVWDASSGQLLHILSGHTNNVFSLAWSPDGQWLAIGSGDSTRIWNVSTGEPIFILRGHTNMIRCVAWSPNGQRLATSSDDGTVRVWDVLSGQVLYILKSTGATDKSVKGVMNVAWSPNGQWLASSHHDGSAWIWNTSTGKPFQVIRGHTNTVNNVVWSPGGQRLATSSADSTACIWFLVGSSKGS